MPRLDEYNWIEDYATALEALDGCTERKIGHNTTLRQVEGGGIHVRLHDTDIIEFRNVRGVEYMTLRTGGWSTVTTKDRLNRYTPAWLRVWAEDYLWHFTDKNGDVHAWRLNPQFRNETLLEENDD